MATFKIEGMTCGHCAAAVAKALARVPGVERVVEVNVARGEAVVDGSPDAGAVARAVEAEGYRVPAA